MMRKRVSRVPEADGQARKVCRAECRRLGHLRPNNGDAEQIGLKLQQPIVCRGATIHALYVHVVPMSLPLDAQLPEEKLARAEAALQRAKRVGEEYEGVEVSVEAVRGRTMGSAIVGATNAPRASATACSSPTLASISIATTKPSFSSAGVKLLSVIAHDSYAAKVFHQ